LLPVLKGNHKSRLRRPKYNYLDIFLTDKLIY
jgi:hypothetical protein